MPIGDREFNLHDFRTTIGDPARPYLFLVHIPEIGTNEVMTTLARATELPGYNLGSVPIPFQGVPIKIGAPPEFPDWTVTFLCDEAHELRRIFMRWQSLCYDVGNMTLGHSNSYKSDQVAIAQMARNGEKVAVYGFIGAWPRTVGAISIGHDQTGNIETFEVTWSYDYFTLNDDFGDQVGVAPFIRSDRSPQIDRGAPPPAGNWNNPFTPQ